MGFPQKSSQSSPLPKYAVQARRIVSVRAFLAFVLVLLSIGLWAFYYYAEDIYIEWITVETGIPGIDVVDSLARIPYLPTESGATSQNRAFLFVPINRAAARQIVRGQRFCRVLQGAIVSGWHPIVFDWGVHSQYQFSKPFGLHHILHSAVHTSGIKFNDLILMIDSWDVWLQLPPSVMAKRYQEYGDQVIVGAERACWPNKLTPNICGRIPVSPVPKYLYMKEDDGHEPTWEETPPQFANSGTIIGRFDHMKRLYEELTAYMISDEYAYRNDTDQGAFNDFLAEGKLSVDYYNRLFWSAFGDTDNMDILSSSEPEDGPIEQLNEEGVPIVPWPQYPPLGRHLRTGDAPVALHFNNRLTKPLMESWWGRLWWHGAGRFRELVKGRMDRGVVRFVAEHGYKEESLRGVCSGLDVWEE